MRCSFRLRARTVFACFAVIAAADLVLSRWALPVGVQALFDEPAHAATGLLALAALSGAVELPVLLAILAGSLLIDLDHVPGLFGSHILTNGTPRPYTHSLLSVLIVAAAAIFVPRRARKLVIVAALALVLHFVRDMAEPGGPGVALLWPTSDRAYTVSYSWYAAVLGLLVAIALTMRYAVSATGDES